MGGLRMESKGMVAVLLAVCLAIGVVCGYAFDKGNNTLLFACIIAGLIGLIATYAALEKGQDEEYGNKIGKF